MVSKKSTQDLRQVSVTGIPEEMRESARNMIRKWVDEGKIGKVEDFDGDVVEGWYSILGL